jgi:hypothetical protein
MSHLTPEQLTALHGAMTTLYHALQHEDSE